MRPRRTTAGALLAGAALLTATATAALAPATASAASRTHVPSELLLTISDSGARATTAQLLCDPPGGTHPASVAACRDLHRADGKIEALPGDARHPYCPMLYRPVTATAKGTWRGQPVSFTSTYPNRCVLTQRTGPVFQF